MKFAAELKANDHGLVGTALADWCRSNPSSAAQMIEKLRDQNSARLKIINDKMARIHELETAKVSIDVDCLTNGDGHRVFGRVVDWQPEDYEAGGAGKGIGVRLLCEYESNNFGMQAPKAVCSLCLGLGVVYVENPPRKDTLSVPCACRRATASPPSSGRRKSK